MRLLVTKNEKILKYVRKKQVFQNENVFCNCNKNNFLTKNFLCLSKKLRVESDCELLQLCHVEI